MKQIKLQYEARYIHVLGFPDDVRRRVAPFLKLSPAYGVTNADTINERILLRFPEDNYSIEVRIDRALLIIDGDSESMLKETGITSTFFNLLTELSKAETFIGFRNTLLGRFMLQPSELAGDTLASAFAERYTAMDSVPFWTNEKPSPRDLSLTIERGTGEGSATSHQETLHFGPFVYPKDVKAGNLYTSSLEEREPLVGDETGVIFQATIVTNDTPSFQSFSRLIRRTNELLQPFKPL